MRKDVIEAQIVLGKGNVKRELGDFIRRNAWKKIFLVAGKSFSGLAIGREFAELEQELSLTVERFSEFFTRCDFCGGRRLSDGHGKGDKAFFFLGGRGASSKTLEG